MFDDSDFAAKWTKNFRSVPERHRDNYQNPTQQFLSQLENNMNLDRFFLTKNARLGRTHAPIQNGDRIAIISGQNLPIIITPLVGRTDTGQKVHSTVKWKKSSGDVSIELAWLLLGSTYVHGIMNGELVSEKTKWDHICIV